jgi:hypothetical protein
MESDWEFKALETLPELKDQMNNNRLGPAGLWIELHNALTLAYDADPVDDNLIGRIYDYASWCFRQPETNDAETDLSSATAVGLIENLPLNYAVASDLYRWLSVESFEGFENLLRCHLSEEDYQKFRVDFLEKKQNYSVPSRR